MINLLRTCFAACAALTLSVIATPAHAQAQWDGVPRIVVIGDLEGDYQKFAAMLREAGLTDANNDWSGGSAHLVQLGDIPDRGPNSRAIMDLLMRLEPQAQRAGGRVHALIGNHEAMNVVGDLRYVHPGEYEAFTGRNSARLRRQYYQRTIRHLRRNPPPEGVPEFDDAYRESWEARFPLGYVEHRTAWAPSGTYGAWVAGHDAVIRINDTLFLHAGVGPTYAAAQRQEMNDAVRAALRGEATEAQPDILSHEDGPLWYRGLALHDEAAEQAHLETLLAQHGVERIVVGHTKRASTVYPRFGGRVIIADIAVPEGYADPNAYLVIEGDALATMHRGHRVHLNAATPEAACAYLTQISAIDGGAGPVARLAERQCASGSTDTDAEIVAE